MVPAKDFEMITVNFGQKHRHEVVNVYHENSGDKIGTIRRAEDKPKYIWFPSLGLPHEHRFIILSDDLEESKEQLRQLIERDKI